MAEVLPTDNDLRTRLHNAGTGEWVRRARFARTDETRDEMLRVSQLCVEALDEFDRLERERAEWAGVAAVRNRNIVLIAEERDRLRVGLFKHACTCGCGDPTPAAHSPSCEYRVLCMGTVDVECRHTDVLDNKCRQCGETRTAAGWLSDPRND